MATKTSNPPIHTNDNKPVVVGQKLYGVDMCGDGKVVTLEVIQIDTGVKREVRMRKPDGIEWKWSPNSSVTTCRSQYHCLFHDKQKATALVKTIKADKRKKKLTEELGQIKEDLRYSERLLIQSRASVSRHRRDIKGYKLKVRKAEAELKKL